MEVQRKPFPTISQESSLCHPWLSVCTFLPQTLKEHPSINILLSVSWGVLSSHKPGKREEVTKLRHPWSRFITWSQQEAYRSVTVQLFLQRPRQILSRSHKDRPSWKHFKSAHFQTETEALTAFCGIFFLFSPQHNVEFIVPLITAASGLLIKSHILFSQDTGASKHRLTSIHEILPDRKGIPIKTDF